MSDDDSSSDSEVELKRKLVLMQFVPVDDNEEYEIVDNPFSDDEEDEENINYDRYDTDKELQKMEPVARITRAYNIRGYPEYRKKEIPKDGKWYCSIRDGETRTYEATDQNKYIANHLAAIHFMKDLIKRGEAWMTQLGLPNDISRCNKILDDKFEELQSESKEIVEINGKNPLSFLNEFCSFYKSKITIKEPAYKEEEGKDDHGKPAFICTGTFRGQKFTTTAKPSKKAAKTAVATMFVKKLNEMDEIRPFVEDRMILKRGKYFKDHILYDNCETQRNFDQYFEDDPFEYASICNGSESEIQYDIEKREFVITAREHSAIIKTDSKEEAKKEWAVKFLRKAFVDRFAPEFFETHLPAEMINSLNDYFHEITIPEPWENEER
uniref:DRBM domain-containing protein n=1 Tax=Panagrolaimus sp. PS1159 TaxID=55785 RepID=A0AC35FHV7_9BILA